MEAERAWHPFRSSRRPFGLAAAQQAPLLTAVPGNVSIEIMGMDAGSPTDLDVGDPSVAQQVFHGACGYVQVIRQPRRRDCVEVPYRSLSHPAVTLWEQRRALAWLRQQGRDQVDDQALFAMIEQMRNITHTAQKATRKARRDQQRRQHLRAVALSTGVAPPADGLGDTKAAEQGTSAVAFDDIEEW